MMTVVVLALASILFLSVLLITAALMMRGQWDKLHERQQKAHTQTERHE